MQTSDAYQAFARTVANAAHILVVQADNPDADSLASALALESILCDMDKTVSLYCRVDMPSYLHYLSGWDRVTNELPKHFDAVILVDASVTSLLEILQTPHARGVLASKPFLVLDHHATVRDQIDFAEVIINDSSTSSTGELIYRLAKDLNYPLTKESGYFIMAAILGDTQGLTNELASVTTYQTMAQLLELGVSRPALEEARREYGKMPETIFRYKADLLKRVEFFNDGEIAVVSVPHNEIVTYSPLYNPSALVQFDMLQVIGVRISIVFKVYDNGKVSAAIRANSDAPIAGKLAELQGGGGHAYASGFKNETGRPYNEIKSECILQATALLEEI